MKVLIFVMVILPASVLAQLKLAATSGLATFEMSELKRGLRSIRSDYPVNAVITHNFPAYLYFDGALSMTFSNNIMVGVNIAYTSTGGRVSYADYSGRLQCDILTSSQTFMATVGKHFKLGDDFFITAELKHGLTFTKIKYNSFIHIGPDLDDLQGELKGTDVTIQPTFTLEKRIKRMALQCQFGILMQLPENGIVMTTFGDPVNLNIDAQETPTNWTGLRAGIGIGYYFTKRKQD